MDVRKYENTKRDMGTKRRREEWRNREIRVLRGLIKVKGTKKPTILKLNFKLLFLKNEVKGATLCIMYLEEAALRSHGLLNRIPCQTCYNSL